MQCVKQQRHTNQRGSSLNEVFGFSATSHDPNCGKDLSAASGLSDVCKDSTAPATCALERDVKEKRHGNSLPVNAFRDGMNTDLLFHVSVIVRLLLVFWRRILLQFLAWPIFYGTSTSTSLRMATKFTLFRAMGTASLWSVCEMRLSTMQALALFVAVLRVWYQYHKNSTRECSC